MAAKKVKSLKEIRGTAEGLVKAYNEAVLNGDFQKAHELDEPITQAVNEYTHERRVATFEKLANTKDPMLEAVKMLTFDTIRVRETKTEDEKKVPVKVIEDTTRPIDLIALNKFVAGGIGKDANWLHMVQKFNFFLTAQKCVDLGINPKTVNDSYSMSEIAKEIDMGKTPTSNTNLLKTLQSVITAMIGEEYKATSHDRNYLTSIYSKKKKQALTVACANHRYLTQYIAEICHRIVTDKGYSVEYKQIKK